MIERASLNALAALVVLAIAFAAGWQVKGWKESAAREAQARAEAADIIATLTAYESTANKTLTELQAAKGQQTIIRREVIREVEKYRDRPCLDGAAVELLNRAANGSAAGVADGALPGDTADPP